MKKSFALIPLVALILAACNDGRQAELERRLQEQQQQIAQQKAQLDALQAQNQDQTVYRLQPDAVDETLSPEAQQQGKNGATVTGNDGQQYIYDQPTGSWLLQSLIGSVAGAFIGGTLANKFAPIPHNSRAAEQVRSVYARQYAPRNMTPRQQAAEMVKNSGSTSAYRPTQKAPSNYQQPKRRSVFGNSRRGFGRRR